MLTLREGELDSRLRDRERIIEELNQRLRTLAGLLRKEQTTNESLVGRLTPSPPQLSSRGKTRSKRLKKRAPSTQKLKKSVRRLGVRRQSAKAKKLKQIGRRR